MKNKNLSNSEYLSLLSYEAVLVQEIEIHQLAGNANIVRALSADKQNVSAVRRRMKLILENKKQQVLPTLTATK